MTYSIVAFDPKEQEWGVATQSKFLGVGAVVPFAKAGVGAIATQSYANTSYGPDGLAMLTEGKDAQSVLAALTSGDDDRDLRQVGVIDASGGAASFTGEKCYDWAGGITGTHFAAQGNILIPGTVEAMAKAFEETEGTLAERMLASLAAGQAAGGDSRGQQSAALLVVKENGGYGGNDRYIDLRVDDHKEPVQELIRLHSLHRLYFGEASAERIVAIENDVENELVIQLTRLGYLTAHKSVQEALRDYLHTENFEMREQKEGYVDLDVVSYMKKQEG